MSDARLPDQGRRSHGVCYRKPDSITQEWAPAHRCRQPTPRRAHPSAFAVSYQQCRSPAADHVRPRGETPMKPKLRALLLLPALAAALVMSACSPPPGASSSATAVKIGVADASEAYWQVFQRKAK